MRGVITHISDPKRKTSCITAFNKVPDTHVIDPSRPKILVSQAQFFCVFRKFLTTTVQSLSDAVIIMPRYFNDGTKLSERPYDLKSLSVISCISSTAILCYFRSTPFVRYVVLG